MLVAKCCLNYKQNGVNGFVYLIEGIGILLILFMIVGFLKVASKLCINSGKADELYVTREIIMDRYLKLR